MEGEEGGGGEWRKDLERKRWRNRVAIHWGTEGGGRGEEEQWRGVKREGGWEMQERGWDVPVDGGRLGGGGTPRAPDLQGQILLE